MQWIHALIQCHIVTHSYFEVDALCEGSRAECHGSMHPYMYFEVDAPCEGSRAESMHLYMKSQSTRQGKSKQLRPKTTPFSQERKRSCLRRDLNLQHPVY